MLNEICYYCFKSSENILLFQSIEWDESHIYKMLSPRITIQTKLNGLLTE